MYIGIDDTDSIKAGCTTHLVFKILQELSNYSLLAYPNLVRLNPNIPFKTRGNGAIVIKLGIGEKKKLWIGENNGIRIHICSEKNKNLDLYHNEILEIVKNIVYEHSDLSCEKTHPGIVISDNKLPPHLYWLGVRDFVSKNYVLTVLKKYNCLWSGFKKARGIVGAACAIAWKSAFKTYEIITYRKPEKIGTDRYVDVGSVIAMDKKFLQTFNNYDYDIERVVIVPRTNCPVLYGIRSIDPACLIDAKNMITSEDYSQWIIFKSNQASDEHLVKNSINKVKKYQSAIISGEVIKEPITFTGGHVKFIISNKDKLDVLAYEPTKNFRTVIRKLIVGDKVEIYGRIKKLEIFNKYQLNLEKIKILKLASNYRKIIPKCICGKNMKSKGKCQRYVCKKCKSSADAKYVLVERDLKEGWYDVPVCARHHLYKPSNLNAIIF